MSLAGEPTFLGVQAKIDRASEQVEALHRELNEFGAQPNPYRIVSEVHEEGRHYLFRLYPAWEPQAINRWGVIIGEITHDLHSALDQLVWQWMRYVGVTPSQRHHFPLRRKEPTPDFATWATRAPGRDHGPLCGAPARLVEIAERCQPYQGGNAAALGLLRGFWLADKHKHLIPILLASYRPTLQLHDVELANRLPDRYEGEAQVVEVFVTETGSNPRVDVKPRAPFDIAFAQDVWVIKVFNDSLEIINTEVLGPIILA